MPMTRATLALLVLFVGCGTQPGLNLVPNTGDRLSVTAELRIHSEELGYDLQYRVFLPPGYRLQSDLPVIYVTDGQAYVSIGGMPWLMQDLTEAGTIAPAMAVFIDSRDPNQLTIDRRREEFACNSAYIRFVTNELVPEIEASYPASSRPRDRVMLGLSMGGLNAACFGFHAHETFGGVAMQSPALGRAPELIAEYERSPRLPLKIFLSTGTVRDGEERSRAFRALLERKEYELSYIEVPHGHDWSNWGPLLDDVLVYFFGRRRR